MEVEIHFIGIAKMPKGEAEIKEGGPTAGSHPRHKNTRRDHSAITHRTRQETDGKCDLSGQREKRKGTAAFSIRTREARA
jgi:hypothetical protein